MALNDSALQRVTLDDKYDLTKSPEDYVGFKPGENEAAYRLSGDATPPTLKIIYCRMDFWMEVI